MRFSGLVCEGLMNLLIKFEGENTMNIDELQKKRVLFLKRFYELSGGDLGKHFTENVIKKVSNDLIITQAEAIAISNYWNDKSVMKVKKSSQSHNAWPQIIQLTSAAIDEVEKEEIMSKEEQRIPTEILESLKLFKEDYPDPAKVAFIMMRFGKTQAHKNIEEGIKNTLSSNGITGLRADDKGYHDDLFYNILTYIYGCGCGIAIFERIEADEFNPNVALEVGYMLALGKPVCYLKDRTLEALQTDIIGKLYKQFDPYDPIGTIPTELAKWLLDKGIVKKKVKIEEN